MVTERNHAYSLVLDKDSLDISKEKCDQCRRQSSGIARIFILASLVSNVFLAGYIVYTSWQPYPALVWSILGNSPAYPVPYFQFSNYSSPTGENDQDIVVKWDNIIPEHGVVALDHTWATTQGLSPATSLPSDDTKGIYLIDVYHSIHCLREIRRSWYQLWDQRLQPANQQDYNDSSARHCSHCFDYLLRSMVCNPSDHVFAHWENGTGYDGQERQCRDWRVIRDWASVNSACDPSDTENLNSEHLELPNLCHGKDDFVPHGMNTI